MSKQLYPKPKKSKKARQHVAQTYRYHVFYEDPKGEVDPEWKHYNSETAVRADAYYQTQVLGFHTKATLFTHDEFMALAEN